MHECVIRGRVSRLWRVSRLLHRTYCADYIGLSTRHTEQACMLNTSVRCADICPQYVGTATHKHGLCTWTSVTRYVTTSYPGDHSVRRSHGPQRSDNSEAPHSSKASYTEVLCISIDVLTAICSSSDMELLDIHIRHVSVKRGV